MSRSFQRALTLTRLLRHASSEARQDASRIPSKVKKPFSELPNAFILPDGTRAPDLGEWYGGPDPKSSRETAQPRVRKKRVKTQSAESAPAHEGSIDASSLPKVSKVRRKPKESAPDTGSFLMLPRKKARKRATTVMQDNASTNLEKLFDDTKEDYSRGNLADEIVKNLQKFPHCLLLTRVGQFYESYFDQASEIAHLLNIKLTSRKWHGSRVPMCGFPLMHLDKHLKVLVQQNKRFVAMCEEFPRYSNNGVKDFERRVVRIITPGTLIDEPFLNPFENNYLLSISTPSNLASIPESTQSSLIGLAWMDVSTGEFFSKLSAYDSLQDELARIGPREVVLDHSLQANPSHPILLALAEEGTFFSYIKPSDTLQKFSESSDATQHANTSTQEVVHDKSTSHVTSVSVSSTACATHQLYQSLTAEEESAVVLLTTFLHTNLLEHMPAISSPKREGTERRMQIDSHTIKALEIRESIYEGGSKGSLLSVIKRTITSGGTRLLAQWLCSPSTSISEINARQSLVALFYDRPHFRADLVQMLGDAEDTGRIIQKFLLGRGDLSDLIALNKTIKVWSAISKRIEEEKHMENLESYKHSPSDWFSLDALRSRMVDMQDLSTRISNAFNDGFVEKEKLSLPADLGEDLQLGPDASNDRLESEPNTTTVSSFVTMRYGYDRWIIKPSFSEKLGSLHLNLQALLRKREKLEQDLQARYDASSLTLRSSPGVGIHVHLSKAKRDQHKLNKDPSFISISESGTTKCYFYQDWSKLSNEIAETTLAILIAEKEVFEMLRDDVNRRSSLLRRNANVVDEMDVALAFSNLARDFNFVRPFITQDAVYNVMNGRHPAVELGLFTAGRVFTPNSLKMEGDSTIHVITGPNMAGKSTFLRQTALIAILAQIGSFVPAESATIGIVDKLFSRIGAKDDLFRDRSTFMVEMLETADILRRATPQSLVIMDEVGRGTTVKDGLAIAFATVHHLVTVNQCRSLFATHFHELSDMLGYSQTNSAKRIYDGVQFYCTDVDETDDGHFAYSYRLRKGVNYDSHGLKVAQLAGMPPAAMSVATETLSWLKRNKMDQHLDTTGFPLQK